MSPIFVGQNLEASPYVSDGFSMLLDGSLLCITLDTVPHTYILDTVPQLPRVWMCKELKLSVVSVCMCVCSVPSSVAKIKGRCSKCPALTTCGPSPHMLDWYPEHIKSFIPERPGVDVQRNNARPKSRKKENPLVVFSQSTF